MVPGLIDVSTDREQGGLQANVVIDRLAAARLCVNVQDIDSALNDAFAQAQVSTIYAARNQYRVILEVDQQFQRDPSDLNHVFVKASGSASGDGGCAGAIAMAQAVNAATGVISGIAPNEVPLSAVARFEKSLAPLVVNHQGQFPSVTITYNLASNIGLEEAYTRIQRAVTDLNLPDTIHPEAAGDVKAFAQTVGAQPVLLVAALVAVYIVLGVLYESLAHPITIISTLPSAGLGALLALHIFGTELTVIAFIGIILLIGIVKKNGIMMVDFALEAERRRGRSPEQAIFEACLERFRPILMTTMAALLGAVPLVIAVTFMLPALSATRPLRWYLVPALLAFQALTLLICRIPIGQIVRPVWRLKWLFLFLIGCYTLLPPENPAGDLVLHWRVPGREWLFPFNLTGLERAAVMCLQILIVLLASAIVRLTGRGDDLVHGLRALRLPGLFVYSLDRTLSLLSGADERSGRRQRDAGAQRGAFPALNRLLRADVGAFVQSIEANIELAGGQSGREGERKFETQLAHDVAIVSGIALCMASFKMLKFLPGLPFASGHKALLLFPLYVLAARLTHSRWGGTAAGTIMGVIGFLQGDGRFGVLDILRDVAPGFGIDLAGPLVRRLPA